MKRFMGSMPASEIEKSAQYKDNLGLKITIEAGPNGWTILYADSSSEYKDVENTTELNFKDAYDKATKHLGELTPIDNGSASMCSITE